MPRQFMHPTIKPATYHKFVQTSTKFFTEECGFIQACLAPRLSIMAACEDPKTVVPFSFRDPRDGNVYDWALNQSMQMMAEDEILRNPAEAGVNGYFMDGVSYRDEAAADFKRRWPIFPMREFEGEGGIGDLVKVHVGLLEAFGIGNIKEVSYLDAANRFDVKEIGDAEEAALAKEFGATVVLLRDFPAYTNPFWNMRRNSMHPTDPGLDTYDKIDVIGTEEMAGSAARECSPEVMRAAFFAIEDGEYAKRLFALFGEHATMAELDIYLELPFRPRFGAGIGVYRYIDFLQKQGCL